MLNVTVERKPESQLSQERRLIFCNLLNGVPVAQVAQAFHRADEKAVLADFNYVALKIKAYAFPRQKPYIPFDTIAEARQDKINLLEMLARLNLDAVPVYSSIKVQPFEGNL